MALPDVHDAILAVLEGLPRGRLLDLPAGQGALTERAAGLGYTATAADVDPTQFCAPGLTCTAADIDAALPFADGSFDVVVCAEGIEHAENQYHLFRELTRVLAPGGHLVLSTPNPLSLTSRLRFLLTGFDDVSPFPIRHDEPRISMHHINPVTWPFLDLMCRRNGLEVIDLRANRIRKGSMVLALFLLPLVWLRTWMVLGFASRRPAPMPEVHARLQRRLLSAPVLFGRVIVMVARRGSGSGGAPVVAPPRY